MLHFPNQAQPDLVGFADIRPHPIADWQQYRREGQQYLDLAQAAFLREKKAFTTEILYNLIAMAIEKLVMAALMEIGRLPYNHTMHDLVAALKQWLPETIQGLEAQVCSLDRYQDICDPYAWSIRIPTRDEIQTMLELARNLEQRLNAR
ncbi:hypothetical protein [Desulfobulbus alkaliphilus]|uniref:hypothetical protein n=1 Tax=Desulfobulbus alkaliphilus TaxID=869814 RepID=UPI001963C17D|nr:hypothetical protein [Desulfobulbus alkaliphilus]MBM9537735.1 hypothetical protein [Desulfobulbus alkaliphilus]